jgi:hypothetical protein
VVIPCDVAHAAAVIYEDAGHEGVRETKRSECVRRGRAGWTATMSQALRANFDRADTRRLNLEVARVDQRNRPFLLLPSRNGPSVTRDLPRTRSVAATS